MIGVQYNIAAQVSDNVQRWQTFFRHNSRCDVELVPENDLVGSVVNNFVYLHNLYMGELNYYYLWK